MTEFTLHISGMHCASCVGKVEAALANVDGIDQVAVNLAAETARISLDAPATLTDAEKALSQAGYPARTQEAQLQLEGLTCAGCVRRAEQALQAVEGVLSAQVNLASQQARVTLLDGTDSDEILRVLRKASVFRIRLNRRVST